MAIRTSLFLGLKWISVGFIPSSGVNSEIGVSRLHSSQGGKIRHACGTACQIKQRHSFQGLVLSELQRRVPTANFACKFPLYSRCCNQMIAPLQSRLVRTRMIPRMREFDEYRERFTDGASGGLLIVAPCL